MTINNTQARIINSTILTSGLKYYVANMGFTRNEVDMFGREVK